MQAIRVHEFGGPDVLSYETVPDLPAPGRGEVLLFLRAVGVNPVETYIRNGTYANLPQLPYTPGTDAAGVVEAVGEGVESIVPGDVVYTSGTLTGAYAQKALAKAETVFPLPENITFEQGAGVFVPYATAYRALVQRAQGRAGQSVLVHGASGGVGTAAVQIARWLGFMVWGTAGSETGRELVREQGAHVALDHNDEAHLTEGKAQTPGGAGWDIILEMAAHNNLGRDLSCLAPGGRVVVIGSRAPVEINARDLMGRDADILGMSLLNASPQDRDEITAALFAGLSSGALAPVVGVSLFLAEAVRAHREILDPPQGAHGQIVLVP